MYLGCQFRTTIFTFVSSDCGQVFDESSTGSKYPWNVGIYKFSNGTENYKYVCGGSLVSERVVVTGEYHTYIVVHLIMSGNVLTTRYLHI